MATINKDKIKKAAIRLLKAKGSTNIDADVFDDAIIYVDEEELIHICKIVVCQDEDEFGEMNFNRKEFESYLCKYIKHAAVNEDSIVLNSVDFIRPDVMKFNIINDGRAVVAHCINAELEED